MKHTIYIVQEQINWFDEVREPIIRAFACKRTAKKFIQYKLAKLNALQQKLEHVQQDLHSLSSSELKRLNKLGHTNSYTLKEVILQA